MKIDKEDLYELIAKTLKCDASLVKSYSSMRKHFKWDSLSHISIITAIEDKYSVAIPDEMIMELVGVDKIGDYLESI